MECGRGTEAPISHNEVVGGSFQNQAFRSEREGDYKRRRASQGDFWPFVTTSVIDDPTRPWLGVFPVFSSSATSRSLQSPI
jgi:hypothetical protein